MNDKSDLRAWAAKAATLDHLPAALGIELQQVEPGSARVRMKVAQTALNAHGNCHGGAIFTLADTALFYACNSRDHKAVAAGCNIDFLRPAVLGDVLTATARERHLGKRSGLFDIEVHNQAGKLVAVFSGRTAVVGD